MELTLQTPDGLAQIRWWVELGLNVEVRTRAGRWLPITPDLFGAWRNYLMCSQFHGDDRIFRLKPGTEAQHP